MELKANMTELEAAQVEYAEATTAYLRLTRSPEYKAAQKRVDEAAAKLARLSPPALRTTEVVGLIVRCLFCKAQRAVPCEEAGLNADQGDCPGCGAAFQVVPC
jgi:hypothetical protein